MFGRIGGIRVPSEIGIKWEDIRVDRIKVVSPKTGRVRFIPIFPELKKWLTENQGDIQNHGGTERIFPAFPEPDTCTFYYKLKKILTSNEIMETAIDPLTGKPSQQRVTPWPKLVHSLRASRESELVNTVGIGEACKIIGNSIKIMMKYYYMLSDDFYVNTSRLSLNDCQNRVYKE